MDEIESDQARVVALVPNGCLIVTAPEWQSLRTAIEQRQARIARIEKALHLLIVHGEAGLTDEHDIEFANETLNEHPRQSVAEIEARALERFRRALRGGTYMDDEWPGINFVEKWLHQEADRIRSEAKDSS